MKKKKAASETISIIIPVYNQAQYLFRAVSSAYWQLGPKDDIFVINDGSKDVVGNAGLDPFMDRVKWRNNPGNKGICYSRNRAIKESKSDWIKFLDADDILAPFTLNAIHYANPRIPKKINVLTGGCHRMFNNQYGDFLTGADDSLKYIMSFNPMLPSATFVRRKALLAVGLFDPRIDFEEDWDMWLKLHERYGAKTFKVTEQPFCYYWIEDRERAAKVRTAKVEGIPVREYFRKRYGATPDE